MILLNKFIFGDLHKINALNATGHLRYKNNKLWIDKVGFGKSYANQFILLVSDFPDLTLLNTDTSGVCQIDFDIVAYPQANSIVQKYYDDDAQYSKIDITAYSLIRWIY